MILESLDLLLDAYQIGRWLGDARRWAGLWRPVAPVEGVAALAAALAGVLAAVMLSGIAVAALGSFLTAILALYLLLTRVFGISVEIREAVDS